jgi:hypothetical protein
MSGSNGRGMSGSNGRGMSGSNGRGMSGSNGRGMSGSNGRSAGFGAGFELAAMGAVDKIAHNVSGTTIAVAGQEFKVSADRASEFAVGDYVVAGTIGAGVGAFIYHVGSPYLPGVSSVRIKGTVGSVGVARAELTIGSMTINYAQQLSADPAFWPIVGDVVDVVGVQPAFGASLFVDSSGNGISVVEITPAKVANRQ